MIWALPIAMAAGGGVQSAFEASEANKQRKEDAAQRWKDIQLQAQLMQLSPWLGENRGAYKGVAITPVAPRQNPWLAAHKGILAGFSSGMNLGQQFGGGNAAQPTAQASTAAPLQAVSGTRRANPWEMTENWNPNLYSNRA